MRLLSCGILFVLILFIMCGVVSSHGNLSVYSYGTNYIVWNVGGNTLIWLDGRETEVYGLTYGQYDLQPATEHIGCNLDGNCTGITTKDDFFSVFSYWGIYFILIGLVCISFFVPISCLPALAYGSYLLASYLPSINAGFNEYSLVGILMALSFLAAIVGWKRLGR